MCPILFFNSVGWWGGGAPISALPNPIMNHKKLILSPVGAPSQRLKTPSPLELLRWTTGTSALLQVNSVMGFYGAGVLHPLKSEPGPSAAPPACKCTLGSSTSLWEGLTIKVCQCLYLKSYLPQGSC